MSQVKISAVIIARNEEHIIRLCLETVRWADEIVVVDNFSTDMTQAISREFTDKGIVGGRQQFFPYTRRGLAEEQSQPSGAGDALRGYDLPLRVTAVNNTLRRNLNHQLINGLVL